MTIRRVLGCVRPDFSRDIIGQAEGMLMERYDIDALRAFDLLTWLSPDADTELADIAGHLAGHDHPSL